jgi:hypothetical protein
MKEYFFKKRLRRSLEDWEKGERAMELAEASKNEVVFWHDWTTRKFSLTLEGINCLWTFTLTFNRTNIGGQIWILRKLGCSADWILFFGWFQDDSVKKLCSQFGLCLLEDNKRLNEGVSLEQLCEERLNVIRQNFFTILCENDQMLHGILRYASTSTSKHNTQFTLF